jgi:hypothetical protein
MIKEHKILNQDNRTVGRDFTLHHPNEEKILAAWLSLV